MRQLCPEAQIDSAGLCAYEGDAPDIYAVTCAARHGIDISGLRSRPVRADDFAVFDRILAMDADSAGYLELRRPQGDKRYQKAKIENLAAYAGVSQIPNPYGTDGFEAVYDPQKAPFFLVIPDIVHGGEVGGIFAEETEIVLDVVSEIIFDL